MRTKLFILILICSLPTALFAQSAKDAYKALKRIEMQTQTGVNLLSYRNSLVDAKLEMNMFLKETKSLGRPLLVKHLKRALLAYDFANEVWTMKNRGTDSTGEKQHYGWLMGQDLNRFSKTFPSLKDPKFRRSFIYKGETYHHPLDMKIAIQVLWGEASEELKSASDYLFSNPKTQ